MCGIAGFTGIEGAVGEPSLRAMITGLHHRGPDDSGLELAPRGGIGMARLAIVGIDNGHQPIVSEDGRYVIVGNGEIYDAPTHRRELERRGHQFKTDSDIEALLHLFEDRGEECFSAVNGMFAVAILDRKTSQVLVARDRLGIKPLFYASVGDAHFFASELNALIQGLPREADLSIDPGALGDYLAHGYIPAPRTIVTGVRRLCPGHYAWLGARRPENSSREPIPRRWWRLPTEEPDHNRSIDSWAEEVAALLEDSVRLRTLGDVPAGAFLSGGLDSSAILAVLSGQVDDPVKAFTLGFSEASHDEREAARETAEALGADHHTALLSGVDAEEIDAIFRHLGEPFGDVSILPTDRLSKLASGHVKFVLSGDGGDELFGGYQWFTSEARRRSLPAPVRGAAQLLGPWLSQGQDATGSGWLGKGLRYLGDLASESSASFLRRRRLAGQTLTQSLLHRDLRHRVPGATSLVDHAAHWPGGEAELWLDLDRRFYLAGDILEKVDRASMRHSLEARVPFLDHRIVELSTKIPVALHLGEKNEGKQVLRAAIEKILPPALFSRPKRGFGIPVDPWLRGPLRRDLRDRLLGGALVDDAILDEEALEQVLDRHDRGVANHGHLLWALWSLAIWAESRQSENRTTPPLELA